MDDYFIIDLMRKMVDGSENLNVNLSVSPCLYWGSLNDTKIGTNAKLHTHVGVEVGMLLFSKWCLMIMPWPDL